MIALAIVLSIVVLLLSVLVAGQAVLNAASAALGRTLTDLTDLDGPTTPGE